MRMLERAPAPLFSLDDETRGGASNIGRHVGMIWGFGLA